MQAGLIRGHHWLALAVLLALTTPAQAAEIGQVKVVRGHVVIERQGKTQPATVGGRLQAADIVRTGVDGAVGITMDDDSLLSAGPNSELVVDRYAFDATTNQGHFDTSLNKGTLSVISGRIAKQAPDAMTVRTPNAILGARGTEFVVSAND